LNTAKRLKQSILLRHFSILICSVYLFKAALYMIIFVLHKEVLFHYREVSSMLQTNMTSDSSSVVEQSTYYPYFEGSNPAVNGGVTTLSIMTFSITVNSS
jgi:hypothetical protein